MMASSSSTASKKKRKKATNHEFIQVQTKNKKAQADMVKPSIMIRLGVEDFSEQFAALFEEHVEGFTGMRGSKRPKSKADKEMEWRVRLQDKKKMKTTANKVDVAKAKAQAIANYKLQKKLKKGKR